MKEVDFAGILLEHRWKKEMRLIPDRKSFPCKWSGKPAFGPHTDMSSRIHEMRTVQREIKDCFGG